MFLPFDAFTLPSSPLHPLENFIAALNDHCLMYALLKFA